MNKWEQYKDKWRRHFEWIYKENKLGSIVDYVTKMLQHRLYYVNRPKDVNREKLSYMSLKEVAPVIESFDVVEKYTTPQCEPE
jgi:ribonucleoside-diphosphate reductase beta chain